MSRWLMRCVSKWWVNRVNVTFSFFGLVSRWNDDGSRIVDWSLW